MHAIGYAGNETLYHKLRNNALGLIILACAGSLPGYWTAMLTVDTVGRKSLQVFGFLLLTIVFCILGFAMDHLSEGATLALYIIGQFLFNAGPNTTTFIVPAECFPTRYRATAHGISAAMGKIGAILAQAISIPLLKHSGSSDPTKCHGNSCSSSPKSLLQLFALFMLLGTLVSLLIPETKGITLEELSGEPHTSYNDGCNGSVKGFHPPRPWWHPRELFGFWGAGQPAGFNQRSVRWGGSQHGSRHQSPRLGIMSSPQMVGINPETAEDRQSSQWRFFDRSRKRKLHSTADSEDIAMMRRDAHTAPQRDDASEETAYVRGTNNSLNNLGVLATSTAGNVDPPTWGAGWGRIDRGGTAPRSELRDVGMLLRD